MDRWVQEFVNIRKNRAEIKMRFITMKQINTFWKKIFEREWGNVYTRNSTEPSPLNPRDMKRLHVLGYSLYI